MKKIFAAASVVVFSLPLFAQNGEQPRNKTEEKKHYSVEVRAAGRAPNLNLSQLTLANDSGDWRKTEWSAIVQVFSQGPNPAVPQRRRGMGFIAAKYKSLDNESDAGVLVLTDYHVMSGEQRPGFKDVQVKFFKSQSSKGDAAIQVVYKPAEVASTSIFSDQALLKVPLNAQELAKITLPPLVLGAPEDVPADLIDSAHWSGYMFKATGPDMESRLNSIIQLGTGTSTTATVVDGVNSLAIDVRRFWYVPQGFERGMSGGPLVITRSNGQDAIYGNVGYILDVATPRKDGYAYPLDNHVISMFNLFAFGKQRNPEIVSLGDKHLRIFDQKKNRITDLDLKGVTVSPSVEKHMDLGDTRITDSIALTVKGKTANDKEETLTLKHQFVLRFLDMNMSPNSGGGRLGAVIEGGPGSEAQGKPGSDGQPGSAGDGSPGGSGDGSPGGSGDGSPGGSGDGSPGGSPGNGTRQQGTYMDWSRAWESGYNLSNYQGGFMTQASYQVENSVSINTEYRQNHLTSVSIDGATPVSISDLKELMEAMRGAKSLDFFTMWGFDQDPGEVVRQLVRPHLIYGFIDLKSLLSNLQNFPFLASQVQSGTPYGSLQGDFLAGRGSSGNTISGTIRFPFRGKAGAAQELRWELGLYLNPHQQWQPLISRFFLNGKPVALKSGVKTSIQVRLNGNYKIIDVFMNGQKIGEVSP